MQTREELEHEVVTQFRALQNTLKAASGTVWMEIDLTIAQDRKSTRLNSSHGYISYAVFCLINEMQNETQKEIAGIQSATSRQNTQDQVYAQNEMLAYQQKESPARVASIMENTNLSKQQQVSEIIGQMLTQAHFFFQYLTNPQIKEIPRQVTAEV